MITEDINEDQEEEIKELLNLPGLKGSEIFQEVYFLRQLLNSLRMKCKKSED